VQGQPVFRVASVKKALAAACKRLSLQAFSPRSLRRCFITRAVEHGIDFKTIAAWQAHRDGGVLIAKTYSHLRNEHSESMAKRLGIHSQRLSAWRKRFAPNNWRPKTPVCGARMTTCANSGIF